MSCTHVCPHEDKRQWIPEWILTQDRMHGAGDYTCYEGMPVKGAVERVFLRGKTIVQDGRFLGQRGDGKYLKRRRSSLCK